MAELMASNFVHNAIDEDLKEGKYTEGIHTRFSSRTKWIFTYWTCKIHMLKISVQLKNIMVFVTFVFDDTNPVKEDVEYVDSIQEDVKMVRFYMER